MKTLHVLYQSLPQISGSSIRSRDIMMSQKEVGIDVLAITSPFQNSIDGGTYDTINGINYIRTSKTKLNSISDQRKSIFKRIARLFSIVNFSIALYKTIKKEKPDILHAHAMFFCAIPSLFIGKILNIPVVYEFRSLWMFQKTDPKNKSSINKKVEQMLLNIEILCLKKAQHAIILNENLKEFIVTNTKKTIKNTVINNAVNTSLIQELKALQKKTKKEDSLVFGYIGTLTAYEGLEFLIKTFQELYEEGFVYKLIIYGKGVNKESVINQINAKNIPTIEYKGSIAPSNVHEAFAEIDVIINPRLDTPLTNSVTPLKPLEAMAYEKVFIGSDVGGIKELVQSNNGFLFKAENKNDLKKTIKKVALLKEDEKKQHLKNALQYVIAHKSWIANAKKYKQIYLKLLKEV